jgi:fatty-acid desaturase
MLGNKLHQSIIFLVLFVGVLSLALVVEYPKEFLIYSLPMYFLTTCVGGTITYHRLLSHRSFVSPKLFYYFGILCAVWGGYGSPISWAAVHREHHRHTDQVGDPHSPLYFPWWKVQFLSIFCKVNLKLVPDLLQDPFLKFIHRNYFYEAKANKRLFLSLFRVSPAGS